MSLKVIVRSENFLMTMTLLELYDIIVGYESDVDFTAEKVEHIERLRQQVVFEIFHDFLMIKYFKHIKYFNQVVGWIQRKLPGVGQYLDLTSERSIKGMMLREYVDIVENRWKMGK